MIACSNYKHRVEILFKQSCFFEILDSSCGAVGHCRRQRVFLSKTFNVLINSVIFEKANS